MYCLDTSIISYEGLLNSGNFIRIASQEMNGKDFPLYMHP